MKLPLTRDAKIKRAISKAQIQQLHLREEYEEKDKELRAYCRKHKSMSFAELTTNDYKQLLDIYEYFDNKYPIEWQGGLRCDTRGMSLHSWVYDDPDYMIIHLSSTSENICFGGSTSWLAYAPELNDKIKLLKTIKKDILKILNK